MKKILWMSAIMISTLSAVELRIGKGSYDTLIDIKNFMHHDTTNDTLVFTLTQPHAPLLQKPLFYYYELELLTSDTKRQKTEFAGFVPHYQFPLVGSINDMTNSVIDMFPVDGDYEALGFDLNGGLGYDIVRQGESYVGLALNVGATLPTINAEDLSTKASLAYDLVQKWDLDVSTYKIGPLLKANLALDGGFSLYGASSFGFQKAFVKSELFKSSVDVKGDYSAFDIGVKYNPTKATFLPKNISLSLGYSVKKWSVDSVDVNLYNFFKRDVFSPFETELKSRYFYLGVGYHF